MPLFVHKLWLICFASGLLLCMTGCEQGPQYDYRPQAKADFTTEFVAQYLDSDTVLKRWSDLHVRARYDSLMYLTELLKNYKEEVALVYAEEARSLATQKNWRYGRAVSSYYVAMLKGRKESYGEGISDAIVDAQLCQMLFREHEAFWWATTKIILGNFYKSQSLMDSAQHYLYQALEIVESSNMNQHDSLKLRGEVFHELLRVFAFNDAEKVGPAYRESVLLYQLTENRSALARLRLDMAIILGRQEKFETAEQLMEQCLAYSIEANDKNLHVEVLQRKAWLEHELYWKDRDERHVEVGFETLQEALAHQGENKFFTYELMASFYYAKFAFTKEDEFAGLAISYYKSAIQAAREEGALSQVKKMGNSIAKLIDYVERHERDVDYETILGGSTARFYNENYVGILDTITDDLIQASIQTQRYQRNELESVGNRRVINQLFVSVGILLLAGLIFLVVYQQQQKEKLKAQMESLRAQINPHFISNSLNAIESLVNLDQKEAASKYLVHFSRLSRRILNSSREANTSLAGELETLKHFLALEQLRFSDKLSYTIEVEEGINPLLLEVPSMIMQPYVENAIWHGLKPKASAGSLKVYVAKQKNRLVCTIEDDGIGRDKSRLLKEKSILKRKSLGMQITEERLQANRKIKSGSVEIIDLKDAEGNALGTRVQLYLPIKTRKKKTDSKPLT